MKNINARSLLIGLALGAGAILMLGQKSATSPIGRYQMVTDATGFAVIDTTTGQAKLVNLTAAQQWGKGFEGMTPYPAP